MSEYQYYEFLALDQPLSDKQMREVRSFSTRARITPTSFVNEYHWGDFKGDIDRFLKKYYDAFVYFANWGTRDLRFRLPKADFDVELAKPYCTEDLRLRMAGEYVILSLFSDDEPGEWDWEGDGGWMPSLAPLRADLLAGDWRCLYLGWLPYVGCYEVEEDKLEPPVPPGLGELTAPLRALADFLRIDESLIEVAAEASPPLAARQDSAEEFQSWIKALPADDKDSLLCRLTEAPSARVQQELLCRFRRERPHRQPAQAAADRRTVGQLLRTWEKRTAEKRKREAEKKAREEAHRQAKAAKARQKYLDQLATRENQTWRQVETLIRTCQPKKYDEAVQLLRDLCDLAEREGRTTEADSRVAALRETHRKKSSFFGRLDKAGL